MHGRELITTAGGADGAGPGAPRAPITTRITPDVIDAEVTEAPSLHLREYLRILYKHRWLAGTLFGLTLAVAALATLVTARTYTATSRLQVSRQSPIQLQLQENVLRVDGEERSGNGSSSFLTTQVAILKSRDLAERVIRAHDLETSELFQKPTGREGVFAVSGRLLNLLRPRGWSGSTDTGPEEQGIRSSEASPGTLARYLGYLSVNEVRGSDLIDITFSTPNPGLSAFLTAAHTQAYMEVNDEARLATNVTAKAFLGEQLREAREKLERAEGALRTFATEHPEVAIDSEHKVVRQRIQALSELYTKAEGARVAFESRYEFLTRARADAFAYFLDKPGVQRVRLHRLDVAAQRAAIADRLGANHPDMVALRQQEEALDRQVDAEVVQETEAVRAQYEAHRVRAERLRAKLDQVEQQAIAVQTNAARYEVLRKDIDTARSLRDSLLRQQMETAVNSELAASNIRVVDRAEVPQAAAKPNVRVNLMLGAFVGVLFAVGVTLLVEYFDSSVKSSEDVETLLHLPTLAIIPSIADGRVRSSKPRPTVPEPPGSRQGDLVVHREPRSLVAEAFRTMRTAVLFSAPGAPPRVILLTSAGASEGKTFASLNLAATLAASGSRVLLVDADLRRPSVHRAFGLTNDNGLSRYLAGQATLEDTVREVEVPSLTVVTAGPLPPNPAELIGSSRMTDLLEKLRDLYDFVILDSPPSLPVTDAVLLSREADGVVLVVKGHDTPRELVKRARDQLAISGAHMLGALINNVNVGEWGGYGYGHYYARYYGAYYGASHPTEQPAA